MDEPYPEYEDFDGEKDFYGDSAAEAQAGPGLIAAALRGLHLFGDDPYLSMQATNVDIVDGFCMLIERQTLNALMKEDGTPADAFFLGAQSQMWMFAIYETLRTWRERAKNVVKWSKTGGLASRISHLRRDVGFRHYGQEMQASQLEQVLSTPAVVKDIEADIRRSHMPFARIEALRIAFAKHEVAGKQNSVAFAPGYGRIDHWTGSLKYEISSGRNIIDYVSRRDIANDVRAMASLPPPSQKDIDSFDAMMRGPPDTLTAPGTASDPR